jgi:glucuronate isomerase
MSYPRHEYFRRILCNLLGMEMEQGLIPGDFETTGTLISAICSENAGALFESKS